MTQYFPLYCSGETLAKAKYSPSLPLCLNLSEVFCLPCEQQQCSSAAGILSSCHEALECAAFSAPCNLSTMSAFHRHLQGTAQRARTSGVSIA